MSALLGTPYNLRYKSADILGDPFFDEGRDSLTAVRCFFGTLRPDERHQCMEKAMTARTQITGFAAGAFGFLALATPVDAQNGSADSLPDPQLPAPNETIPEQIYPCNPGGYQPEPGAVPDVPAAIDCGEVIVPPPGVDAEITEPPPEPGAGTMPIIPPSAIDEPTQ
jgi:hypothetical protein